MASPSRTSLSRSPQRAAPGLLGAVVESRLGGELVAVRLVEVEAYAGQGQDPASHAHRGRTARNATMFGPAGHAYVYFTYGMHWCLNVASGAAGEGGGILLRAGEVLVGLDVARGRRPAARRDVDLARGPARLAAALGVDGGCDGLDLLDPASPLRLRPGPRRPRGMAAGVVTSGPRVGVSSAQGTPWRFWLDADPHVSAYRPGRAAAKPSVPRGVG